MLNYIDGKKKSLHVRGAICAFNIYIYIFCRYKSVRINSYVARLISCGPVRCPTQSERDKCTEKSNGLKTRIWNLKNHWWEMAVRSTRGLHLLYARAAPICTYFAVYQNMVASTVQSANFFLPWAEPLQSQQLSVGPLWKAYEST